MDIFEIKIWLAVQLIIDFLFVFGIIWYLSRVSRDLEYKLLKRVSSRLDKLLSPFLKDAVKTSYEFDSIIKEKKKLIKELNNKLDSRISSLNFFINRADNVLKKQEKVDFSRGGEASVTENRDKKIAYLHEQGFRDEEIAKKVGISAGEVSMIISLMKKLKASHNQGL